MLLPSKSEARSKYKVLLRFSLFFHMHILNLQWKNNVFTIICDSRLVVGSLGHGLARCVLVHSINIVHRGGSAAKRSIIAINLLIACWGYSNLTRLQRSDSVTL